MTNLFASRDNTSRTTRTDPIAEAGSRFSLGTPRGRLAESAAAPSPEGLRPYVLRFARPFASTPNPVAEVPEYWYDPVRQIAVLADGSDAPMFKHTNPKTVESTGTPDGQGGSQEETRNDWQKG